MQLLPFLFPKQTARAVFIFTGEETFLQTKKRGFSSEAAYVLGILTMALGTAMMASADFGMSMVVAPAYLTYLKLSQTLPFFTFGMAEYLLQALLLVALGCVRGGSG